MKARTALYAAALALMLQMPGVPATGVAGAAANDGTAPSVLLRADVVVEEDHVWLSDLFDGVPADLDKPVSASPPPGRARLFTAGLLRKFAQENGLDWEADHGRAKVRLERAGEAVSKERVIGEITLALRDAGVTGPLEVEVYNRFVNAILPRGMGYAIFVETMEHFPRDGRLTANIRVEAANGQDFTARVMGRVHPLVQVPTLARSVLPGDIIQADDIAWQEKRAHQVNRTQVSNPDAIIGMQARRSLSAGMPILATDIEPNMVVKRRDVVTLVVESAAMRLTARGVALEDGALGDIVRIRNTTSDRVVEGRVAAAGLVEVLTGAHLAQLSQ